ncbi:Breast cancer type 1 susceptibility protein (RING finger protein 53) (RING-type E3 ubiquitin transferase BRCA1), partial [Durusdinium trenchii]
SSSSKLAKHLQVGGHVTVARRMWPGVNKPGGVGKITKVNADGSFDVKYMLDGRRDRAIPVEFVSAGIDINSSSLMGTGSKAQDELLRPVTVAANGRPKRRQALRVMFHPDNYISDAELNQLVTQGSRSRRKSQPAAEIISTPKRAKGSSASSAAKEKAKPVSRKRAATTGNLRRKRKRKTSSLGGIGKSEFAEPVVLLTGTFGNRNERRSTLEAQVVELGGIAETDNEYKVTHLVTEAETTADGARCAKARTLKYVRALCTGRWIVDAKWVQDSYREKRWLSEAPYELDGDLRSCETGLGGPKRARLERAKGRSEDAAASQGRRPVGSLLAGVQVFFVGRFPVLKETDLREMVELCGGQCLENVAALSEQKGRGQQRVAVCYDKANARKHPSLKLVSKQVADSATPVVNVQWLLNSISTHTKQPTAPYAVALRSL